MSRNPKSPNHAAIFRLLTVGVSWTVATFAGYMLATLAGIGSFLAIAALLGCDLRAAVPLPETCNDVYDLVLFFAAVIGGAGLGTTQYAVLRVLRIPIRVWWLAATCIGFAIPVGLAFGFLAGTSVSGGAGFFTLLGLSLGLAQWIVLRNRFPGSVIWIPGSLASTLVAGLFSGWTVGSPFSWLVAAAGSALTLLWLLRRGNAGGSTQAIG